MSLASVLHEIIDRIPWPNEETFNRLHKTVEDTLNPPKTAESETEVDSEPTPVNPSVQPGVVSSDTLFGGGIH